MSLGTTTAGGFLVSYEVDPQVLISGAGFINPMRDLARVELVSQNDNRVRDVGRRDRLVGCRGRGGCQR